jgi:hypothetical protein
MSTVNLADAHSWDWLTFTSKAGHWSSNYSI